MCNPADVATNDSIGQMITSTIATLPVRREYPRKHISAKAYSLLNVLSAFVNQLLQYPLLVVYCPDVNLN